MFACMTRFTLLTAPTAAQKCGSGLAIFAWQKLLQKLDRVHPALYDMLSSIVALLDDLCYIGRTSFNIAVAALLIR